MKNFYFCFKVIIDLFFVPSTINLPCKAPSLCIYFVSFIQRKVSLLFPNVCAPILICFSVIIAACKVHNFHKHFDYYLVICRQLTDLTIILFVFSATHCHTIDKAQQVSRFDDVWIRLWIALKVFDMFDLFWNVSSYSFCSTHFNRHLERSSYVYLTFEFSGFFFWQYYLTINWLSIVRHFALLHLWLLTFLNRHLFWFDIVRMSFEPCLSIV